MLPAHTTIHLRYLPNWSQIDTLISNLKIKMTDDTGNMVIDDLEKQFTIDKMITEIMVE